MERFGITVRGQTRELLLFLAVGAALGVWYELFRIRRLVGHHTPWRVFWQDMAAAVGAAFLTMLAALPISNGQVRLSHLLALLLGAGVYYVTCGRLLYGILRRTVRGCGRVRRAIGQKRRKIKRKSKKEEKSFKKHLQHSEDM